MFIDTHVHFDHLEKEIDTVLVRAQSAQVTHMLAMGGNPSANIFAVNLAMRYPDRIRAAVGLDRDQVIVSPAPQQDELERLAAHPSVAAIGEIGLDYHYHRENAAAQRALFARMLALGIQVQKPVIIHTREADTDTLATLREYTAHGAFAGVIHCYTGTDPAFLDALLAMNLHISFSGIITFANANKLRAQAARVPDNRLLIETDTPFLTPVPHRGQRNEPAYVIEVARGLAKIRGGTLEDLAAITTRNARHLFGFP